VSTKILSRPGEIDKTKVATGKEKRVPNMQQISLSYILQSNYNFSTP
jgi:hypothetical protein